MAAPSIQPLSEVRSGHRARIIALAGGREFQARLMHMGLNVGFEIDVIHSGDGRGGPTLVASRGARLAIGHGMAEKIMVATER